MIPDEVEAAGRGGEREDDNHRDRQQELDKDDDGEDRDRPRSNLLADAADRVAQGRGQGARRAADRRVAHARPPVSSSVPRARAYTRMATRMPAMSRKDSAAAVG